MSLLLLFVAQVGPFSTPPKVPRPAVEGRSQPRAKPMPKPSPKATVGPSRLELCLAEAERSPAAALGTANRWLVQVSGAARAGPLQCLGTAESMLARWSNAEQSFIAARDATPPSDRVHRARMGGIAANSALAAGGLERALGILNVAHSDAVAAGDVRLAGEVAIDQARTLVALKRDAEADKKLIEARTSSFDNPLAWLLSATLSRRQGKLRQAQAQITTAEGLAPGDPEIALEAGVIAVLDGRDALARQHWQAVIAADPQGELGRTAQGYLAQIEAKAAPSPAAPVSKPAAPAAKPPTGPVGR